MTNEIHIAVCGIGKGRACRPTRAWCPIRIRSTSCRGSSLYLSLLLLLLSSLLSLTAGSGGDKQYPGRLMSLADLNHDQYVDMLLSKNGSTIDAFVANDVKIFGKSSYIPDEAHSIVLPPPAAAGSPRHTIVNAALADFDGDSFADLLVTTIPVDLAGMKANDRTAWFKKHGATAAKLTYDAYLYWGSRQGFNASASTKPIDLQTPEHFPGLRSQPAVINFDLNEIADIFVLDAHGQRTCYMGRTGVRKLADNAKGCLNSTAELDPVAPIAWVDILGAGEDEKSDLNPEIILRTKIEAGSKKEETAFEVWQWSFGKDKEWVLQESAVKPPFHNFRSGEHEDKKLLSTEDESVDETKTWIGPATFADIDLDGAIDILIPYCPRGSFSKCHDGAKLMAWLARSDGTRGWESIALNLTAPSGVGKKNAKEWAFVTPDTASPADIALEGMTLRPGDFDRSGYLDLMATLVNKDGARAAFLVRNSPCIADVDSSQKFLNSLGFQKPNLIDAGKNSVVRPEGAPPNCLTGKYRRFEVVWEALGGYETVSAGTFLDVDEDGSLNELVEATSADGQPFVDLLESTDKGDTCFLKVQVYTGVCGRNKICPSGKEGSGVSLPGACVAYDSFNFDGSFRSAMACQLSQTTHRALQIPYTVFGLGQYSNFVEKLTVAVPRSTGPDSKRSWPQIIPNSRLYIIPYPQDQPSKWIYRLFVTPSRLILMSFATLASVCGVILIIIVALHIREKHIDRKEKLLESHRFHFDAM